MAEVRFHMNDIKADLGGGGSDTITINFEEHDPIAIPNHSHNMADGTSTTLNYGGVLFHATESAEFSEKANLNISGMYIPSLVLCNPSSNNSF
ncbi:hypothetical protein EIK77_006759 [Talaromyces pinophilus]|nr:hypothetical protein EIK77_006759 [Talaromyces pinophilus]